MLEANLSLVGQGLAPFTFGNASGVDRERGSRSSSLAGVPYEKLEPEHMVVTDLLGTVSKARSIHLPIYSLIFCFIANLAKFGALCTHTSSM